MGGDKEAKMNNRNNNIITNGAVVRYCREPELESIIGEITVAHFQLRRLKKKSSDKVAGYIHHGGGYYRKDKKDGITQSFFDHTGMLYRLSI